MQGSVQGYWKLRGNMQFLLKLMDILLKTFCTQYLQEVIDRGRTTLIKVLCTIGPQRCTPNPRKIEAIQLPPLSSIEIITGCETHTPPWNTIITKYHRRKIPPSRSYHEIPYHIITKPQSRNTGSRNVRVLMLQNKPRSKIISIQLSINSIFSKRRNQ